MQCWNCCGSGLQEHKMTEVNDLLKLADDVADNSQISVCYFKSLAYQYRRLKAFVSSTHDIRFAKEGEMNMIDYIRRCIDPHAKISEEASKVLGRLAYPLEHRLRTITNGDPGQKICATVECLCGKRFGLVDTYDLHGDVTDLANQVINEHISKS